MKHDRLPEEQISKSELKPQEKPDQTQSAEVQNTDTTELDSCRTELQIFKEKFTRVTADLQNFRNRTEREKLAWTQDAQVELIKGLLPIIDNFERALGSTPRQELSPALTNWFSGLELTYKDLIKFLTERGVKEIDCSTTFDPHVHEALVYIQTPEKPSGYIVEIIRKGYMINETVIRPAQVCVAK